MVDSLVKVVVDNLSKIDDAAFLDLNFRSFVQLYSRGMDESKISDVILTVNVDDHELSLPKLFVVGDLVVVGLTLSNFENGSVSLEVDFDVLELLSIDRFELELESLLRDDIRLQESLLLLEDTWRVDILSRHVLEGQVAKDSIGLEVLKSWVGVISVSGAQRVLVSENSALEGSLIELELVHQRAVSDLIHGFRDEFVDDFADDVWASIDAHDMHGLNH